MWFVTPDCKQRGASHGDLSGFVPAYTIPQARSGKDFESIGANLFVEHSNQHAYQKLD